MNYAEFVASRFKGYTATITDIAAAPPSLMGALHAVVGMVGEALEYRFSTSRGNLREELGDFVFYWEAFQVAVDYRPALRTGHAAGFERPGLLQYEQARSEWLRSLGELLDLSKKEMVYAQELDATKRSYRHGLMVIVAESLWTILHFHGLTVDQLQRENMEKLLKRFPTGYSNKAAQERSDKPTQVEGQMALHYDPALAAQITRRGQEAMEELTSDPAIAAVVDCGNGCQEAPKGWKCTRTPGHEGPCAAIRQWPNLPDDLVNAAMKAYALVVVSPIDMEQLTMLERGVQAARNGVTADTMDGDKAWRHGYCFTVGTEYAKRGLSRASGSVVVWLKNSSPEDTSAYYAGFDWQTNRDTSASAGPA